MIDSEIDLLNKTSRGGLFKNFLKEQNFHHSVFAFTCRTYANYNVLIYSLKQLIKRRILDNN